MIIPTKDLSYEGDFTHDVRIIRRNGLKRLKDQIKGFVKELKPYSLDELSDTTLQELLALHHLNIEDFSAQYIPQMVVGHDRVISGLFDTEYSHLRTSFL